LVELDYLEVQLIKSNKNSQKKYVNDRDTNTSHDIGIKVTLFGDDTSILIAGQDT
jgi:hypothetical protein